MSNRYTINYQKKFCSFTTSVNQLFLEVTSPSFSVTVAKQKKKKKGIFFPSCQRWRQIYSIMHCLSALVDTTKTCGRLLLLIIDNSTMSGYEKQRAKKLGKNQLLGVSTKVSKSQLHNNFLRQILKQKIWLLKKKRNYFFGFLKKNLIKWNFNKVFGFKKWCQIESRL